MTKEKYIMEKVNGCPFCESRAFKERTIRHVNEKPFGFKKILLTLEKRELEHLKERVDSAIKYVNIQHYLRILIDKDKDRIQRINYRKKQQEAAAPDI